VSVPGGIGANRADAPRRRLLRFAPSTPPGQRQVRNEDVRSINMAIRRERRFAENRGAVASTGYRASCDPPN
jgi:hypothetical protein